LNTQQNEKIIQEKYQKCLDYISILEKDKQTLENEKLKIEGKIFRLYFKP